MSQEFEIDKETLRLIERLQQEIDVFRGVRHLWAETVANSRDNCLSAEEMMKRQRERLWSIGGAAMNLAAYAFPGQSPHARFGWKEREEREDEA